MHSGDSSTASGVVLGGASSLLVSSAALALNEVEQNKSTAISSRQSMRLVVSFKSNSVLLFKCGGGRGKKRFRVITSLRDGLIYKKARHATGLIDYGNASHGETY